MIGNLAPPGHRVPDRYASPRPHGLQSGGHRLGLLVAFAPDHGVSGVDHLTPPTLLDPLVTSSPSIPPRPVGS